MDEKMQTITVTVVNGATMEVPYGTPLLEIAEANTAACTYPIVASSVNNELAELNKRLMEDCTVRFFDFTSHQGLRVYQQTASLLMLYAAKAVLGEKVRIVICHSINKNYYCEIEDGVPPTDGLLKKIEAKMRKAVDADMPIEKCSVPLEESVRLAERFGLADKIKIMNYRRTANVNMYRLDWFYNYFYGQMAHSAGRIPYFRLQKEGRGFILCFPTVIDGEVKVEHQSSDFKKIMNVFNESAKWAKILKADTVGALNDIIAAGQTGRFIMTNEALHEKSIGHIADLIHKNKRNIVLIAGPSSSGKTTFSERLAVQLRVNGLRPWVISLDNYYRNRTEIGLEADGKPDLEKLDALDVDLINKDVTRLLAGDEVEIPGYNFLTGMREYKGVRIRLENDVVLIMEGIHGLNDRLTASIPEANKFRIFISALTQLNVDDHNRIPTTDTRLIRRIVRDNQFRGHDAEKTIAMWPSVLRGEDRYIFPFQERADAVFNSALVYEMCILKQYVEPLLFKIDKKNSPYTEARRLIKFLDSFLSIPSEEVPKNSILREFIGGSFFRT